MSMSLNPTARPAFRGPNMIHFISVAALVMHVLCVCCWPAGVIKSELLLFTEKQLLLFYPPDLETQHWTPSEAGHADLEHLMSTIADCLAQVLSAARWDAAGFSKRCFRYVGGGFKVLPFPEGVFMRQALPLGADLFVPGADGELVTPQATLLSLIC